MAEDVRILRAVIPAAKGDMPRLDSGYNDWGCVWSRADELTGGGGGDTSHRPTPPPPRDAGGVGSKAPHPPAATAAAATEGRRQRPRPRGEWSTPYAHLARYFYGEETRRPFAALGAALEHGEGRERRAVAKTEYTGRQRLVTAFYSIWEGLELLEEEFVQLLHKETSHRRAIHEAWLVRHLGLMSECDVRASNLSIAKALRREQEREALRAVKNTNASSDPRVHAVRQLGKEEHHARIALMSQEVRARLLFALRVRSARYAERCREVNHLMYYETREAIERDALTYYEQNARADAIDPCEASRRAAIASEEARSRKEVGRFEIRTRHTLHRYVAKVEYLEKIQLWWQQVQKGVVGHGATLRYLKDWAHKHRHEVWMARKRAQLKKDREVLQGLLRRAEDEYSGVYATTARVEALEEEEETARRRDVADEAWHRQGIVGEFLFVLIDGMILPKKRRLVDVREPDARRAIRAAETVGFAEILASHDVTRRFIEGSFVLVADEGAARMRVALGEVHAAALLRRYHCSGEEAVEWCLMRVRETQHRGAVVHDLHIKALMHELEVDEYHRRRAVEHDYGILALTVAEGMERPKVASRHFTTVLAAIAQHEALWRAVGAGDELRSRVALVVDIEREVRYRIELALEEAVQHARGYIRDAITASKKLYLRNTPALVKIQRFVKAVMAGEEGGPARRKWLREQFWILWEKKRVARLREKVRAQLQKGRLQLEAEEVELYELLKKQDAEARGAVVDQEAAAREEVVAEEAWLCRSYVNAFVFEVEEISIVQFREFTQHEDYWRKRVLDDEAEAWRAAVAAAAHGYQHAAIQPAQRCYRVYKAKQRVEARVAEATGELQDDAFIAARRQKVDLSRELELSQIREAYERAAAVFDEAAACRALMGCAAELRRLGVGEEEGASRWAMHVEDEVQSRRFITATEADVYTALERQQEMTFIDRTVARMETKERAAIEHEACRAHMTTIELAETAARGMYARDGVRTAADLVLAVHEGAGRLAITETHAWRVAVLVDEDEEAHRTAVVAAQAQRFKVLKLQEEEGGTRAYYRFAEGQQFRYIREDFEYAARNALENEETAQLRRLYRRKLESSERAYLVDACRMGYCGLVEAQEAQQRAMLEQQQDEAAETWFAPLAQECQERRGIDFEYTAATLLACCEDEEAAWRAVHAVPMLDAYTRLLDDPAGALCGALEAEEADTRRVVEDDEGDARVWAEEGIVRPAGAGAADAAHTRQLQDELRQQGRRIVQLEEEAARGAIVCAEHDARDHDIYDALVTVEAAYLRRQAEAEQAQAVMQIAQEPSHVQEYDAMMAEMYQVQQQQAQGYPTGPDPDAYNRATPDVQGAVGVHPLGSLTMTVQVGAFELADGSMTVEQAVEIEGGVRDDLNRLMFFALEEAAARESLACEELLFRLLLEATGSTAVVVPEPQRRPESAMSYATTTSAPSSMGMLQLAITVSTYEAADGSIGVDQVVDMQGGVRQDLNVLLFFALQEAAARESIACSEERGMLTIVERCSALAAAAPVAEPVVPVGGLALSIAVTAQQSAEGAVGIGQVVDVAGGVREDLNRLLLFALEEAAVREALSCNEASAWLALTQPQEARAITRPASAMSHQSSAASAVSEVGRLLLSITVGAYESGAGATLGVDQAVDMEGGVRDDLTRLLLFALEEAALREATKCGEESAWIHLAHTLVAHEEAQWRGVLEWLQRTLADTMHSSLLAEMEPTDMAAAVDRLETACRRDITADEGAAWRSLTEISGTRDCLPADTAALRVQLWWRCMVAHRRVAAMKHERHAELARHEAKCREASAVLIQAAWRGHTVRRGGNGRTTAHNA